jgi:L-asparagine transporter-like permease
VLVFVVALTAVNLFGVRNYGRFEFWFAAIKVAAIIAFLLVGVCAIVGLIPGVPATGISNLVDEGGFAPQLQTAEEALAMIEEAIKVAGYEAGKEALFGARSTFIRQVKLSPRRIALR